MTVINFGKALKIKGLYGIIKKTGKGTGTMNRIVFNLKAYAYDLQSALELECSREDAVKMGTIKEWKAIDKKVQNLLYRSKKLEQYINDSLT